ncbi:hypothetical protein OG413_35540 [Streptomyces sp. NBC_01433]|uniref:hypothetical protein n=1 Tax=Streptomyces sp. NBC_01433 TaxID=2903864 RepID=UPI00224E5E31|nr:hypothetical protein [Streptomyces sp. NBC_01433]MCX4680530.1 hypothetical protein [Streptomyces sp. NBC_01433]
MRKIAKAMAITSASMILATVTAGCSEGETKSVPKLPKKFCWGAFTPKEVSPLLPAGDKATLRMDSFHFSERVRQASCRVYIDGNQGFDAVARLEDTKDLIEWSSWDPADPDPIDVGEKGIVRDNGAATYFACKPTANSGPSLGKYLELRIEVRASPDKNERQTMPKLLEKFMTFTKDKLKCA